LFDAEMTKMGSKLDDAQKAFQALTGTRTNMLDRQFAKLDDVPALPELS
jgi:DNA anti-recombination protein RmuC